MNISVMIRVGTMVFFGGVLLFGFFACNDLEDCSSDPNFAKLKIRFFDKEDLLLTKAKFDSVKALGSDSLFFISEDSVSEMELDLNPFQDVLTYVLYNGLSTDSLSIAYTRTNMLISPECGATVAFGELEVKMETFDSVYVSNNFFDISLDDNLEIYL